jgi:hypothetical protein
LNGVAANGFQLNAALANGISINGLTKNGYKLRGSLQATGEGDHVGTGGMIITTITLTDGTQIELN